jgi:hypothetical protein
MHVGGSLRVPLAPAAVVDLHGGHAILCDQQSRLVPQHFNPDFWTATLGQSFGF